MRIEPARAGAVAVRAGVAVAVALEEEEEEEEALVVAAETVIDAVRNPMVPSRPPFI